MLSLSVCSFRGYSLGLSRVIVWKFRGLMQLIPPFLEEYVLVQWLLILFVSLEGMMPPLYRQ